DAFANADEAVAKAVARRAPCAVVANLDLELVGLVMDGDVCVARVRVLERVGQALLHDSIGREVDRPRKRESLTLDVQSYRKAGAADLVEQGVEVLEARLRRELHVLTVGAHRAEQSAHLGERRAARRLDVAECTPAFL